MHLNGWIAHKSFTIALISSVVYEGLMNICSVAKVTIIEYTVQVYILV